MCRALNSKATVEKAGFIKFWSFALINLKKFLKNPANFVYLLILMKNLLANI